MLSFPMKWTLRLWGSNQYLFHKVGFFFFSAHSFVAETYPRTASIQTYMVFPSAPLKGAGMPQALSRVSERGLSSSLIQPRPKFGAFSGNFVFVSLYFRSSYASLDLSENQCSDS